MPDSNGLITLNDNNSLPEVSECQEEIDSVRVHRTDKQYRVHDAHEVGTASSRMKDRYIAHLEKQLERLQRELDDVKKRHESS